MFCALSANPQIVRLRPPWTRIDCRPVFAKFYIKDRLSRADRDGRRRFRRPIAHGPDRFASDDELPDSHVNPIPPRQNDIIAASGVDDQELSIAPPRSREGDIAIAWRRNNGLWT